MNRQRKVVITVTYNDLGTIVDTKAEELDSSAEPERKLTNKEWVDFLSKQFTVSRTSAKEMLHVMMGVKKKDNFKKQFNGGKNEKE